MLETIAYAGVDLALMRPGADSREHYDTAWTIQLVQGALIACMLFAIAPVVTPFFSEPRATAVVQVIALRSLIIGFQNIGVVVFRKELDFAKDFRFTTYTKLVNLAVIVVAAISLRNYWALVIGMTSSALIEVWISYRMHPFRPRLCIKKVRELWGFSQWLIIARLGAFLNRKTDELIVGRLLGTSAMGAYHVANELATMPNSELVMPIRRALFPTLAKIADRPEELRKLVLLIFSGISAVCISIGFGLMSIAEELIPVVLGKQWVSAVPAMRWLTLFGASTALMLALEMVLWVTGRTKQSALLAWVELALLVPVAYLMAYRYGAEGAAVARLSVSLLMLPLMFLLVARTGSVGQLELYGALWRPIVAGMLMSLTLGLFEPNLFDSIYILLATKVLAGMAVFSATLFALWLSSGRPEGAESEFVAAVKRITSSQGKRATER